MMIDQNKNTNDENLVDHKLFIGFVDPEVTEVEIVLFSIIKMAGNKYQTVDSWHFPVQFAPGYMQTHSYRETKLLFKYLNIKIF